MRRKISLGDTRYLLLDWSEICALIDGLAAKIEARPRKPNLIVGVFRGGMTVAHLLSDRLCMHELRGIGARVYQRTGKIGENLEIYQPLPLNDLRDYNVLLAEDVVDTGTTYEGILKSQIYPKNPRSLCTVSLHIKPWTKYKPDIYVEETSCWIWYPWETYEIGVDVYTDLSKKHGPETAREMLVEEFGLEPRVVERIARLAEARHGIG